MRQFIIGIVCSTAFLAAASCNKSSENQVSEAVNATGNEADGPYYSIQADDIADSTITAVKGTFHMENATAADGIPSTGSGGACLVFTAKDLGFTAMDAKKCTTNQDCYHDPEDPTATGADAYKAYSYVPAGSTQRENSYGYCDTKNKQCWSKPIEGNNAVCNRPITMTAGTVNPVPKNPPGSVNVSKWVKQGAKVRVVACLNQTGFVPPPNAHPTGCPSINGPDRIEVMGKPATLHK